MGEAKKPYSLISDAVQIFADVRQGDGKYEEAIAAIMWHCGISAEESEAAVSDLG